MNCSYPVVRKSISIEVGEKDLTIFCGSHTYTIRTERPQALVKLLELMNGSRTLEDILGEVYGGHQTTGILLTHSLLKYGIIEDRLDDTTFARVSGLLPLGISSNDVQTALARQNVLVLHSPEDVSWSPIAITNSFLELGLKHVKIVQSIEEFDSSTGIVVVLGENNFSALNLKCVELDIPWLPCSAQQSNIEVGPLVIPKQSACYECYQRRLNNKQFILNNWNALPIAQSILLHIAAAEVAKFTIEPNAASAVGFLWSFDLSTLSSTRHRVLRFPDCPVCGRLIKSIPWQVTRVK